MNKKIILMTLLTITLIMSACSTTTLPEDNPNKIAIYYFWEEGCPSCEVQQEFLDELQQRNSEIELKSFDLLKKENKELLALLANAYEERIIGAPVTFIGEETIIGFGSAETTGQLIENRINQCLITKCKNPADILKEKT